MISGSLTKRNSVFLKAVTYFSAIRINVLLPQRKNSVNFTTSQIFLTFLALSATCQFCKEMQHKSDRKKL